MKPAERRRVASTVRALLPELHEKGRLLAATPRGRILRGIYLEDSADPASIYVWAFVQPLYVPSETLFFSLGKRLGGGSMTWDVSDPDAIAVVARDQGVPFFEPVTAPEALVRWSYLDGRSDAAALQARAYSLIASGQFGQGVESLRKLASTLSVGPPWMMELRQQAEGLADLAAKDPDGAQALLAKWEAQTASALRVHDLP